MLLTSCVTESFRLIENKGKPQLRLLIFEFSAKALEGRNILAQPDLSPLQRETKQRLLKQDMIKHV